MGVSFDLFGTLVSVDRPTDPTEAVARELERRGVAVPDDWADAYAEPHIDAPEGAEVPLPAHVAHALRSRGVDLEGTENAARRAVVAAFDPEVRTRDGALEALDAAREHGPVAICSNCSVPELVGRTLVRADFGRDDVDAIVTSVGCGWRKPAPQIFELTATRLGVSTAELVHVGDDPRTDGGVERVGGTAVILEETPLLEVPNRLATLTEADDER
ncbi:HAD family hydrolase [Natrarchaeobaculum sulfurireducens]|uniref:HAD superfamily hydrolase n=1 Tax=Natrarchaeobaculum sulfurireducens TaxID=2044521 RepID=A0A346PCP5_9EURY|nr:HAD family hydrolase [Natrarchaeobaculum sulfurireducens]AXR77290.1 HAD superfamily hydrolase [Natrarchaeobaculum sulfurireducens]